MPVQGLVTTFGHHEVVPPFETKVKKALTLIDQTPQQEEADKKFLKDGKPAIVAHEELEVLNSCLSAVTVLSFLGGPGGIVLASGIVLFQGLLSMAGHPGRVDPLTSMKLALEKVHNDETIAKQLSKVRAIANTVETQWKGFVDDPRPSAEDEKKAIDTQLMFETNVQGDSLGNSLIDMERYLVWDNTKVRVAILASLTYYFVVWNLQCRIYATLSKIEAAKGEGFNREKYESYVTTFNIRVTMMKNELSARTSSLKNHYEAMKAARLAAVTGVEEKTENPPAFLENNRVTVHIKFTDKYAGNEYSTLVPREWYEDSPSQEAIVRTKKEKAAELVKFKAELEDFTTRSIASDLAVVDQWVEIVKEAELLLRPAAPKVPPKVERYQATEKSRVHKYLENARWVAYAYSVGTAQDGDSAQSPWTDWLKIEIDEKGQVLLPVLTLHDSGQVVETRRTVYHCKCMEEKPALPRPEPTAPEKFLDEWKSEILFAKGSIFWVEP
ncbi:hypothetical protein ACSS6W_006084 [Trichoderma asperelloides]|nr:hypothetical protein LI328DRAFT_141413 [Trichoderma asperelloides]